LGDIFKVLPDDGFTFSVYPMMRTTFLDAGCAATLSVAANCGEVSRLRFMRMVVPRGGTVLVDSLTEVKLLWALKVHAEQLLWHIKMVDFSDSEALLRELTTEVIGALYITRMKTAASPFEINRLRLLAAQFRCHLVVATAVWEHAAYTDTPV
jgi:hypothetical protein